MNVAGGKNMKVDALIMDPKDNVVTCVRDVKAGEWYITAAKMRIWKF